MGLATLTKKHSPQPDGQQVGQQQRWQEDLEELRRKDAALLHDACVAHAERGSALRVLEEQELPEGRGRSAGAGTRPRRPPRKRSFPLAVVLPPPARGPGTHAVNIQVKKVACLVNMCSKLLFDKSDTNVT